MGPIIEGMSHLWVGEYPRLGKKSINKKIYVYVDENKKS